MDFGVLIRELQGKITQALNGRRLVAGRVSSTGVTGGEPGFTSSRTGTGTYAITFDPPFTGTPSLTATSLNWACSISAINQTAATVLNYRTTDGALIDGGFHFQAWGSA